MFRLAPVSSAGHRGMGVVVCGLIHVSTSWRGSKRVRACLRSGLLALLLCLFVAAGAEQSFAMPANDNFANSVLIPGGIGSVSGNNISATGQSGEPNPGNNSVLNSVWYHWTAPASGTARVEICSVRSYDTHLAVFTGAAVNALTTIAANDDAGGFCGRGSRIFFAAAAGTTYYIQVDGWSSHQGTFRLDYRLPVASPNLSVAPAGPFNFAGDENSSNYTPTPQTFTVSNTGSGTLTYSTSTNVNWISTSASSLNVTPSTPATVQVSINPNANSLAPGPHTGTITFNSNGGSTTRTVNLAVNDVTAPNITAPTVPPTEATSPAGAVVSFAATATDNADPSPTITYSQNPGTTFPIGTTTVTVTATDASGNSAQETFDVTVEDTTPPVIGALPNIMVNTDAGQPIATVSFTPTATDAVDPAPTISASPASGSQFPIGTTHVTVTATDATGNSSQAMFDVVVQDAEDPTVNVPTNISVNSDPGLATANVTYSVTFNDNAPGATLAQTAGLPSGSNFPVGVTTNTFVVTDAAGNTATASFTVTVTDNEPPVIVGLPSDINVDVNFPDTSAVVTYTDPTVTDNVPGATIALTGGLASGSSFPLGTTSVEFTATDVAGNSVSQSFNVTVNQIPPGEVTLAVESDVSDGTFGFSSPTPQFNFNVKTADGEGQSSPVTIKPGTYVVTAKLPDGFGLVSGRCDDANSRVNVSAKKATVRLATGEKVTCTFVTADSRTKTVQTIQRFLKRRNDMLLSNAPNGDRQIDRLQRLGGQGGNGTGSGFVQGAGTRSGQLADGGSALGGGGGFFASSTNGPAGLSVAGPSSASTFVNKTGILSALQAREQESAAVSTPGVLPFGFSVGDENARTLSFSTSLVQVARAAAEAKRRKLAGGEEGLAELGINGSELIQAQDYGLDIWVEGKLAFFDDGESGGESDGEFGILYFGADYVFTPNFLLGVLVQFDKMDEQSNDLRTRVEGYGWMAGPYATLKLSDNLFFQSRAAWGKSDNDISPFLTYEDEFETERWLVEGSLQGRWAFGAFALSPRASVGYIEDKQDAYTDSLGVFIPGQTVSLGQARFGPQVSYQFTAKDGTLVEPYGSFEGIWNFEESGTNLVAATLASDEELRGKAGLGLRLQAPGGMSLDVSGTYDGIGADSLEAVTGEATVRLPLN